MIDWSLCFTDYSCLSWQWEKDPCWQIHSRHDADSRTPSQGHPETTEATDWDCSDHRQPAPCGLKVPFPRGLSVYQLWLHTIGRKVWPMLLNTSQLTTLSENNRLPQRFWNNLRKHVGVGSRAPTGCLGWQRSLTTPLLRCSMSQWLSPHVWDSC